jgi:hypothetical protein
MASFAFVVSGERLGNCRFETMRICGLSIISCERFDSPLPSMIARTNTVKSRSVVCMEPAASAVGRFWWP